jgi:hypothetical protein
LLPQAIPLLRYEPYLLRISAAAHWHRTDRRLFSTAPFIGAALSLIVLREQPLPLFWAAGGLMAVGVWLHLTERHAHPHHHEAMTDEHLHWHDEHHQHVHQSGDPPGEPLSHVHDHSDLTHTHAHYPDIHHRHPHH